MRFYASPESIFPEKNIIEIKDTEEIHHIRDVMRLRKGMSVNVFNGKDREYTGEIKQIAKSSVIIEIKESKDYEDNIPYRLTLYQAIPKKGKMDFIVEKTIELGVGRIVPIITERSVPAIGDKSCKKTGRWIRIAKAASKQCGRIKLPVISDVADFNDALIESKKNDLVLFAALDRDAVPLKMILKKAAPKNIAVFVGPEGDFSEKEISMAKEQGCRICSLGPLVLRVETASICILSCLNYEYSY